MTAKSSAATKEAPLVVERTFDAPAALVWRALTEPDRIRRWSFDMKGFAPRVGCEFEFTGGDPQGVQYLHKCKVTSVTFADEGGKTRLKVRQTRATGEAGRGQDQGWSETFDRLEQYLVRAA